MRLVAAVTASLFLTGAVHAQEVSGTLVVTNMGSANATLVDVATGQVAATLPTGTGPHEVAISHDGRWAVVTNYGNRETVGSSLTVIDIPARAVARTIDLGAYQRPHGAAFLPGDRALVVTAERDQRVLVVDFETGTVTRTLDTGFPASHMLALPVAGDRVFTTNVRDGTVSSIPLTGDGETLSRFVAPIVEGIAVSPDGSRLWVGSNREGTVTILAGDELTALDTLSGFGFPYRMAVTPDGATAVISDPRKGEVRVVDAATFEERARIRFPGGQILESAEFEGSPSPEGLAIHPGSRLGFVTLQGRNEVAAIDLSSHEVLWTSPTGSWPDGIGVSPVTGN